MKSLLHILLLLPLLLLSSCKEEGVNREEARIRREVDRRVEAIHADLKVSDSRWKTVRVVAFCLLAGGSLIWLFNGGGGSSSGDSYPKLADSRNHDPGYRRRVIDRHHPDEDEPDEYPYRR
ncbi:MAG: hypothetical protein KF712_16035 [Akkermansiaceae bacterium]|nr:hypothetical protein [Akkermansiaceae bacterium]